jgi:quinol monooxygenase YgiN
MAMVIVQGSIRLADPGARDAYLEASVAGMAQARTEKGCMEFVTAGDPAEPDRVILSERWESMEDLNQHTRALNRRRREAAAPTADSPTTGTTSDGTTVPASVRPAVASSDILIYHVASVQVPSGSAARSTGSAEG